MGVNLVSTKRKDHGMNLSVNKELRMKLELKEGKVTNEWTKLLSGGEHTN
jgi:hypothetical protein